MESADKAKKQHKKRNSGQKAKKKKEKQAGGKVDKHNPRAFTFSGGTRSVQKRVQYQLDKAAKRERVQKTDKNPDVPPPFVVVVQGPPGVGKTTLIRSLVRHYCKQRLLEMNGPITLVSGRQRRLTIVECPQDVSAMLDLAKVADLVLLLIDASYGFELETFEFINILQVHGFPRVIGVLTHLDHFRDNKQLRKTKKSMKHRFWTELYDGAKLFYFSGLQYGRYHRMEVQNLARFIAVQKTPILSWRQSHPYLLALRWEDQTDAMAKDGAPRRLDLYGYVYGGRMREGSQAHLPGAGDFTIAAIKPLIDPCPPPMDVEAERQRSKGADGKDVKKKKNALRTLAERHRVVYAPGSDVGSITVDADAMYINLPEHAVGFTKKAEEEDAELPEAVRLVRQLQDKEAALDRANAAPKGLQLLRGTTVAPAAEPEPARRRPAPSAGAVELEEADAEEADDEGEEEEDDEDADAMEDGEEEAGQEGEDAAENSDEEHRRSVVERARARFEQAPRLESVIYGKAREASRNGKGGKKHDAQGTEGATDHSTLPLFDDAGGDDEDDAGADDDEAGGGSNGSPAALGNLGDVDALDTTRMPLLPGGDQVASWDEETKEALKSRKFITGGWSSAEEDEDPEGADAPTKKKAPDGEEEGVDKVAAKQKAAVGLDGAQAMEGSVPIATFVRVRLEDVPAAVVAELRPGRPIILGGLLAGELRMGMVQLRVKRHRWHPKLMKSGDALLMSVGWRRFQTLPTFSLEDRGEKRMRYLKYTLEHAHCIMTYYGPSVPPNTGMLAFRSWNKVAHFRIAATGGVLESAPNFDIMKKLKLVGEPYKIFRNTAFVKNMFSSDLEVSKYLHTKIQTVSGVRGEIKKAEGTKGSFRATFEDRILMSDLVVCKCWINLPPKKFYHPVIDVEQWRPAKLIGELRAEQGLPVPDHKDSQYGKQVERAERKFNSLKIPKSLQVALPFRNRQKNEQKQAKRSLKKAAAVVLSDREKQVNQLMERLAHVRKERSRQKKNVSMKKKAAKEKREAFIQAKRDEHTKEAKKKRYIKQGQQETQRRKAMKLD